MTVEKNRVHAIHHRRRFWGFTVSSDCYFPLPLGGEGGPQPAFSPVRQLTEPGEGVPGHARDGRKRKHLSMEIVELDNRTFLVYTYFV